VAPPDPPTPSGLYQRATEQYLAGKFLVAEAGYKQALVLDRNFARAHRGLGFVYQRMGFKAKALDSLNRYLRLAPNASDADAIRDRIVDLGGEP
jgi:regulator of sirC expression with transglutaminase-like and TPR domain